MSPDFPSFSEGLSLRGGRVKTPNAADAAFPFLFGGTFIEGTSLGDTAAGTRHFPSFSEGLSLRESQV